MYNRGTFIDWDEIFIKQSEDENNHFLDFDEIRNDYSSISNKKYIHQIRCYLSPNFSNKWFCPDPYKSNLKKKFENKNENGYFKDSLTFYIKNEDFYNDKNWFRDNNVNF